MMRQLQNPILFIFSKIDDLTVFILARYYFLFERQSDEFIVDFKTFLNSAIVMMGERLVEYLDSGGGSCFWQVCFDRRLDTVEVLLYREWFLNVLLTLNLDVEDGVALVGVEAQSAALVSILTHFAVVTVN